MNGSYNHGSNTFSLEIPLQRQSASKQWKLYQLFEHVI